MSRPPMESEKSFAASSGPPWRREPFRLFFPLGAVLAGVGVSHWLFYRTGLVSTYSCELHGFVQMQGFMTAFAVGFLFTAVPRRTGSAPPSSIEMLAVGGGLVSVTAGALLERWEVVQLSYLAVLFLVLQFAFRRFLGRAAGRRPPAAFVLVPIGILHGIAGAALITSATVGASPTWSMRFGKLLVEQGVFLCLVVGIGSLVLPLMSGAAPPADLGSSPAERRKAFVFAGAGLAIFASFALEQAGWARVGPALRAVVVAAGLAASANVWRPPGKPGLHRRLVWLSAWLIPLGLIVSALWPDYRVPALHILFIGGFALMAFGVATHVSLGHLGLETLALGRPPAVVALAVGLAFALAARVAADMSDTYFDHLAWAAASWLIGSAIWLGFFLPKFLRRPADTDLGKERR